MQKQNYDKVNPSQKNIINGLRRLKELCKALFMENQDILTKAFNILKEIELDESQPLQGRGIDSKVSISLLLSLKLNKRKHPNLKEICQYANNTSENEVNACYKKLKKLEKYIPWDTRIMPEDEVRDNARKLNIKPEVQ